MQAPLVEAFKKPHLSSVQCPSFCTVHKCGDDNGSVNFYFGCETEGVVSPDSVGLSAEGTASL